MWISLFIRLGMVAATMGAIFWIGWTVPQVGEAERQSVMPQNDDAVAQSAAPPEFPATGPPFSAAPTPTAPVTPRRVERLDLNSATEQDLESLPGIGPVLAERVIEHRQKAGPFRRVEDLRTVKGIGKKKFERIRSLVSVTPSSGGAHKEGRKAI